MKITKKLGFILFLALFIWGVQTLYLLQRNASTPKEITSKAKRERKRVVANYKNKERELIKECERKKYQATGKTVYDRIFNKSSQSIIELIQNITRESIPNNWRSEVKVEEFTHFILLIYLPHNTQRVPVATVASYLSPLLKYCSSYLTDVAVFDRTHKAYLFFDKDTLQHLKNAATLTPQLVEKTTLRGKSFTRFNSITLQCEKDESHLFLPVEVGGSGGVVNCYMLFDTGASTTTVSEDVAIRTGHENLVTAPQKSFNTANGWMSCPIIHREVNIGGFRKSIEVAVNQNDELSLLGMNYFKGMEYIVDFQNSCIYIWEK